MTPPNGEPPRETTDPNISGGWTRKELSDPNVSGWRPAGGGLPVDLTKLVTGLLSLAMVAGYVWIWNTHTQLITLLAAQERIEEKVDLMYERIVLNPSDGR